MTATETTNAAQSGPERRCVPTKTPSRAELRQRIEHAIKRELERCRIAHGDSWPEHRDWLISYLNEAAREWLRTASRKGRL